MHSKTIELFPFEPALEKDWQEFAGTYGSLYHDLRWKFLIEETYGLKPQYLLLYNNKGLAGLLPGFCIKNKFVSLPYLPFAGIIFNEEITEDNNSNIISKTAEITDTKEILLKNKTGGEIQDGEYITMIKTLESTNEQAFQALHHKQKNLVRRAQEQKFSLKKVSVEKFYPIYSKASNALGTPAHSIALFKNIHKYFGESLRIHNLFLENKTAGTIFEIDHADTRYDLWAFSLKEFFPFKPNMFMYWETLKDAIEKKMVRYDFGRSTFNSGTYHFKKQWGAEPVKIEYYKHIFHSGTWSKEKIPVQEGGIISKVWAMLPRPIVDKAGPLLRKHIY